MNGKLFLFSAMVLSLAACQTQVKRHQPVSEINAKKYASEAPLYELYSWQSNGIWKYSSISTKETVSSFEIITTEGKIIESTLNLLRELDTFPEGQSIFWNLTKIKGFSYPPPEKVTEILNKARMLNINIIPMNY
jgi:hypothetical protein